MLYEEELSECVETVGELESRRKRIDGMSQSDIHLAREESQVIGEQHEEHFAVK